jgi:hypothetical protein
MHAKRTHVDDGIPQDHGAVCRLNAVVVGIRAVLVLQEPTASLLIIVDGRSVVAFVEILEYGGEDFSSFIRKLDAFASRLEELRPDDIGEEGRFVEDAFVSGEESLFGADANGHDGGVGVAVR